MAVSVRFVGSGDAFGSGGRFQTCILVDGPGVRFAIDFGTSSLIALAQQGIAPNSIDAVLLTLLDAMLGAKRERALVVAGPPGTASHLATVQETLFPGSQVMAPRFPLTYQE